MKKANSFFFKQKLLNLKPQTAGTLILKAKRVHVEDDEDKKRDLKMLFQHKSIYRNT